MKTTYLFLGFIAVLGYISFINQNDQKLMKAYDACLQYTHHPDCPESWRKKPAFSK